MLKSKASVANVLGAGTGAFGVVILNPSAQSAGRREGPASCWQSPIYASEKYAPWCRPHFGSETRPVSHHGNPALTIGFSHDNVGLQRRENSIENEKKCKT
jgi:hypothetical protein